MGNRRFLRFTSNNLHVGVRHHPLLVSQFTRALYNFGN